MIFQQVETVFQNVVSQTTYPATGRRETTARGCLTRLTCSLTTPRGTFIPLGSSVERITRPPMAMWPMCLGNVFLTGQLSPWHGKLYFRRFAHLDDLLNVFAKLCVEIHLFVNSCTDCHILSSCCLNLVKTTWSQTLIPGTTWNF